MFGIVFINVFTFPLFNNFNDRIELYYRFYEVKLFDYIEKKLPTPIRYIFNILYIVIILIWLPILVFYQLILFIFLPAIIWSYFYVYLLMTKVFEIFPYDYFLIEYSF